MKVYTKQYMVNEYGYVDNDNNIILTVCSNNDECCYCCDIDDTGNYYIYGGKFEIYNGNKPVDVDMVCDLLEFELCDKIILSQLVLNINNIDIVESLCNLYNIMFNDSIPSKIDYIINHANNMVKSKIDNQFFIEYFTTDENNHLIELSVTDINNVNNCYRVTLCNNDNIYIEYIDERHCSIKLLMSVICDMNAPHNILNTMSDLINMSLHYYMNVLKYSIEN